MVYFDAVQENNMDLEANTHLHRHSKPIPKRSKFRINIFVWTCWQWHKQMREHDVNIKNKLIFASWNESHSLPRRLAIALHDREANANDICNYKDPYVRLGDRYRAYWCDHRKYHDTVFYNDEPSKEFPEGYEKPIFTYENAFPTHINVRNNITTCIMTENNSNDVCENICIVGVPSTSQQQQNTDESIINTILRKKKENEKRPLPPSTYVESPELVILIKYINSRDHEICLSMMINYLKYGELLEKHNDRKRLYELLINAGFTIDFISRHDDYMEYYVCDLKFVHGELWRKIFDLIGHRNNMNEERPPPDSGIVNSQLLPSINPAHFDSSKLREI